MPATPIRIKIALHPNLLCKIILIQLKLNPKNCEAYRTPLALAL